MYIGLTTSGNSLVLSSELEDMNFLLSSNSTPNYKPWDTGADEHQEKYGYSWVFQYFETAEYTLWCIYMVE